MAQFAAQIKAKAIAVFGGGVKGLEEIIPGLKADTLAVILNS
jgi:hypothetical protein